MKMNGRLKCSATQLNYVASSNESDTTTAKKHKQRNTK